MKRFASLLVLVTALLITACAGGTANSKSIALPLSFSANLKGTNGKFNVILTEEECIIGFDEGHPLHGTELRFDSQGGKATVGDFSREVNLDLFPAQKALISAFRGVCSGNGAGFDEGRQSRYTIDKTSIIVYYDEDNKTIIGIETEEGGRRFQFDIANLASYEVQSDSTG